MRYRVPDGCAGVTHDGVRLDMRADGTIEAAAAAADDLAPHGIAPIEEVTPRAVGGSADRARTPER